MQAASQSDSEYEPAAWSYWKQGGEAACIVRPRPTMMSAAASNEHILRDLPLQLGHQFIKLSQPASLSGNCRAFRMFFAYLDAPDTRVPKIAPAATMVGNRTMV